MLSNVFSNIGLLYLRNVLLLVLKYNLTPQLLFLLPVPTGFWCLSQEQLCPQTSLLEVKFYETATQFIKQWLFE